MNYLPLDRPVLKWAMALLVTGATCLSAAEGPMGKPLEEAFPVSAWAREGEEPSRFPFQPSPQMVRHGINVTANILNNKVVRLEISAGEMISREQFRSRQEAWIEALFPGIPKENITFLEPDPKIRPGEQMISCKYGDRSYLAFFGLHQQGDNPTGYEIRVGDAEYFTTAQEVIRGTLGDDSGKKVIQTIFQTK